MGGIAGFTFDDEKLLKEMCDLLVHRGPDDEGYYTDSGISLGSRRLDVIDLKTGRQPIFNEDRSIVVVCDGGIYNFRELREELEAKGHRFYTNSDTEVIVHSYEEWGIGCFSKFNGMFSLAMWDSGKKELILARDPLGIKPLYYTFLNDDLIFASEIKAILRLNEIKRKVDLNAFHYYINLRFVPKELTMFEGIRKLLPGNYIIYSKGEVRRGAFWKLEPKEIEYGEGYLIKRLREILKRAVERHLISDVPVGIYLSGGLDSSIITAFASKVSERPVMTFTMGFGEPTDELKDARFVADHFGTNHRELVVEASLLKDYPLMIWYADMPKRNLYPYYIAKEAAKYVKVVLSGLGSDELFGGYEWKYRFAEDVEKERKRMPRNLVDGMKKKVKDLIKCVSEYGSVHEVEYLHHLKRLLYLDSNVDLYLLVMSLDEVFNEVFLKRIYGKRLLKKRLPDVRDVFREYFKEDLSFVNQIMLADFMVKMVDDFLYVDDSMSMANSLEGRFPFLDLELVEFAFKIPARYKFRNGMGKYILKKVGEGILPDRVLKKAKQGFGGNVGIQFSKEIYEYARQILPEGYTVKKGFVKKRYIDEVLGYRASMSLTKHYIVIWDLLAFEIWYRIFILPSRVEKPKNGIDALY